MSLGQNDIEKLYRWFEYECAQKKVETSKNDDFPIYCLSNCIINQEISLSILQSPSKYQRTTINITHTQTRKSQRRLCRTIK